MESIEDENHDERKKIKPWNKEYDEDVFGDPWPVEIDPATIKKLKKIIRKSDSESDFDLADALESLEDIIKGNK